MAMSGLLQGQDLTRDLTFLKANLQGEKVEPTYRLDKTETNEIKLGAQFLFVFYKHFLSSQDNRHCSFRPSCSTYCIHAIQQRGVVLGLMGAFDRLSRCNGLSPENYEIDLSTGQLIDPVIAIDHAKR